MATTHRHSHHHGGHAAEQQRTTLVSILAAGVLVALKLGVGAAAGSLALISAGVESSGDMLAAVLTLFVVRLGGQPADPEHPYGHARAENLGALGEAGILIAGATVVGVEAIARLIHGHAEPDTRWFVFAVIGVALCVDATRTVVSLRAARRFGSPALRANALHFAGDMVGSVAVLTGLLLVRAGFAQADAIAALAIASIVLLAARRLVAENANVLMDRAPVDAQAAAQRAIARLEPRMQLVRLRVRESAGTYFADVIVAVPPGQAVVEGHQTADLVERAVQGALPGCDVVVHVEPQRSGLDLRDRVLNVALREPLVREVHDVAIYEHGQKVSVSLHLKFPDDTPLPTALAAAERIERAIREGADVASVQTHLEPLERPLRAHSALANGTVRADTAEIERVVKHHTGTTPRSVELFDTRAGRIVFLTLEVAPDTTLVDAHRLSSEVEDELRGQIPDIADVVVHTEVRA